MWQKQLKQHLKQLKKQATEVNPKPTKTKASDNVDKVAEQVKELDIKFDDYCKNQEVKPLKQDTIVLKPKLKSAPHSTGLSSSYSLTSGEYGFDLFDEPETKTEFFRFGQKNLPKEMRNGKYKINAVLDLHGYTKAHAIALLERFLAENTAGSCLKIIHGQGLNSTLNQPVLQGIIRSYLQKMPEIVAYTYGAPNQGGNGVTLIKLKS